MQKSTMMDGCSVALARLTFLCCFLFHADNDDLDDWSSFVCSLALTLTTMTGFVLMINTNRPDPVLPSAMLTTFLIVSNATCFAYEMGAIAYVAYQDRLAKRQKKMLPTEKSKVKSPNPPKKSNVQVMPVSAPPLERGENEENLQLWR